MDILKNISESEERDIIISLPKVKTWFEYLAHFLELKSSNGFVEVVVPSIPKTKNGNKCYIVYDGFLKGWMKVNRVKETENNDICVELNPFLNPTSNNIPMNEIDGFKYYFDDFEDYIKQ